MGKRKSSPWSKQQLAWVDALNILGPHPEELVMCPQNRDAFLVVFDIVWRNERFDRYMICSVCKSKNVMSALVSPEKAQAKYVFDAEKDNYSIDDILKLIDIDRQRILISETGH